jgi:hypothetical protein
VTTLSSVVKQAAGCNRGKGTFRFREMPEPPSRSCMAGRRLNVETAAVTNREWFRAETVTITT